MTHSKLDVFGAVAQANAELYGPATGTFSASGSLGTERADPAAVLLNRGQVLITGGARSALRRLKDVQRRALHSSRAGSSARAVLVLGRRRREGGYLPRDNMGESPRLATQPLPESFWPCIPPVW
jgi:hypothetical protein